MEVTYHLDESELNYGFFQGLKKTFKGKKMTILIKEQAPHEMTKEAFEQKIIEAEKSSTSYVFEGNQFDEYTQKRLAGEKPEIAIYKRGAQ